jgi:hypothetical protein
MEYIIINCPHCNESILVYLNELNCHIFRHGIYKQNLTQINPHLDKKTCDNLYENNLIYGCGKPFKIIKKDKDYYAEICDYI